MTWLSAVLPYVGGGFAGAAFAYGVTWLPQSRRNDDAFRAPQREAIAVITAVTHALLLRVTEWQPLISRLVEDIRLNRSRPELLKQVQATANEMSGGALLDVERAFRIGAITIVDADCWEAMAKAYKGFEMLRNHLVAANKLTALEQFDPFIKKVGMLTGEFEADITALVVTPRQVVNGVVSGSR